ncbi:MAG: deoxyguanosinetriphosphate triphosphohydrolase [Candidatus Omnitrophica bacterium]|nr:deoxyguanosinetriphosphate triphosphohydrolase [Candidatus Omnitrophota bacterium]
MRTATGLMSREDVEAREAQWLAPYAMKSCASRGRAHPEPEDPYRTAYRRDRDRIIHTTAFRRLEYKTQVFVNHEGDHYRTRLTHTLEVAQIGVSLARLLRLNEDLVDAVCLAHDIGHPPFGHAGEDALRELMEGHGGFEHNIQGLRIVDVLETRYPNFPGLNLTWEVRESINKHRAPYAQPDLRIALDPAKAPLLESQLADVADEIAYDNHDLDDGLASGILKEDDLQSLELWRQARDAAATAQPVDGEVQRYQVIRALINRQVVDLATATAERLSAQQIDSVDAVRACRTRLVAFSEEMVRLRTPLKRLLWTQFYHHDRVVRMAQKAKRCLTELFPIYLRAPEQLPNTTRLRIAKGDDPYRVVCDYIAGMTDRYCLGEYRKLCGPVERVSE